MKKVLGLDLGTNSIGWAVVKNDFDKKQGEILNLGSRIIPMSQDILGKFESGQSISATADRTNYRGVRRLYQRDNLRRERLHRVLNILGFLPEHYKNNIDFDKKLGQFIKEIKFNYKTNEIGKQEFIFMESYNEMVKNFKFSQPELFHSKKNGEESKIPYDWTLYYLRKKALTQYINKEELAWLLLNFNQKRGYYQLRGEEEEIQEGKSKTFEILKVQKVVDSGEKLSKTGETLYNVFFENGWKYDKQVTKTENWIEKTKEFIVTTSPTKDGSIKRTYKAVDSEKDWIAIKKKTEQDLDEYIKQDKTHTVGTYIYETLLKTPNQKIRGKLIKTIERKYYKQELEKILDVQIKQHSELQDKTFYIKSINELYRHNGAHKNNIVDKNFKYLFVEDIIFYQRPLKSKKSTISGCQYEKYPLKDKEGNFIKDNEGKIVEKARKTIPKSHPLYQEFRLWQWLKNLRIYKKYEGGKLVDRDVTNNLLKTDEDWTDLFDFLNEKKEIKQNQLISYFFKKKEDKENYRWNYVEDKTYPINETKFQMLKHLKKVPDIKPLEFMNKEKELHLWHIIYSVKDAEQFEQALKTFARKNGLDENEFSEEFKKHPPYKNDYGSYSEKAIKKLLPLMRTGKYWNEDDIKLDTKQRIDNIMERVNNLNLPENPTTKEINEAIEKVSDDDIPKQIIKSFIPFKGKNSYKHLNTYQAGYAVYNRHSEISETKPWKTPEDINTFLNSFKQHSLRNPVVEQIITETLRTVRDIWKQYGDFDEIHLEMGRELKNNAEKRKQMTNRITQNQNTNERIRLLLQEMVDNGAKPHSPSHQEILKIYEEGVYQSNNEIDDDIEKIRKSNSPKSADIKKYKLWLEQGYISPYTGEVIPLSELFTTKYEVEHIIPRSRYFDDSMTNKIICESEVNRLKDNQTAYEFINNHGGQKVDLGQGKSVEILKWDAYESHCNKYFKNNKTKLKNLLTDEIPEGFINRQLNDSRYISKYIKSLLGNIVRDENEKEGTPKRLISMPGAITSQLKHDWGLNDKWNELILPRFERLNKLTETNDFTTTNTRGITIPIVPDELKKGFNKKRIDHRHHALDALVIACCTRKHIQYINSLNNKKEKYELQPSLMIKNKEGHYTKHFALPWETFPVDALNKLETTIVAFKQNLRVINRTNNKYWKYVKKNDGSYKKEMVKQKGKNFAIRKPMHKETVSGILKENASKSKIYTAVRTGLDSIANRKQLEKITDSGIKTILNNHLKNYIDDKGNENFDLAFSPEGIVELNKNIVALNNGKFHHPIYKIRQKEEGSKFQISHKDEFHKNKKYVEAAKGTNLYFAIYLNEKGERKFETIPLNDVIAHQKQQAEEGIKLKDGTPIPVNRKLGEFQFALSPNDLVYVPTEEEIANPNLVDFDNLSKEQVKKIYKMVSSSGNQCFFIPNNISSTIRGEIKRDEKKEKIFEFTTLNKMEKNINNIMIKSCCWKLKTDRLGNIIDSKR